MDVPAGNCKILKEKSQHLAPQCPNVEGDRVDAREGCPGMHPHFVSRQIQYGWCNQIVLIDKDVQHYIAHYSHSMPHVPATGGGFQRVRTGPDLLSTAAMPQAKRAATHWSVRALQPTLNLTWSHSSSCSQTRLRGAFTCPEGEQNDPCNPLKDLMSCEDHLLCHLVLMFT